MVKLSDEMNKNDFSSLNSHLFGHCANDVDEIEIKRNNEFVKKRCKKFKINKSIRQTAKRHFRTDIASNDYEPSDGEFRMKNASNDDDATDDLKDDLLVDFCFNMSHNFNDELSKHELSIQNLESIEDHINEKNDVRTELDFELLEVVDSSATHYESNEMQFNANAVDVNMNLITDQNVNADIVERPTERTDRTSSIKDVNRTTNDVCSDEKVENYNFLFKAQCSSNDAVSDHVNDEMLIKCEIQTACFVSNKDPVINNIMLNTPSDDHSFQNDFSKDHFDLAVENKTNFDKNYTGLELNQLTDGQTISIDLSRIDYRKSSNMDTPNQFDCSPFDQNLLPNDKAESDHVKSLNSAPNSDLIINNDDLNTGLDSVVTIHTSNSASTYSNINLNELYSLETNNYDCKTNGTVNDLFNSGIIEPSKSLDNLNETLLNVLISSSQANDQTSLNFIEKNKLILDSIVNNKLPLNGLINDSYQDWLDNKFNSIQFKRNSNFNDQLNHQTDHVLTKKLDDHLHFNNINKTEVEQIVFKQEPEVQIENEFHNLDKTISIESNETYQLSSSTIQNSSNCLNSLYSLTTNFGQFSSATTADQSYSERTEPKILKEQNDLKPTPSSNPFSLECRIPLPGTLASDHNMYIDNKNFIKRRNQRERIRVKSVNDGFENLRKHLPVDYEQFLDQTSYPNCYLTSNLDNSNNSSTNDLIDFKNSIHTDNDTFYKDQNSINYSTTSSNSSTTSSTSKERRLSKVETLRLAINYIKHLEDILNSS